MVRDLVKSAEGDVDLARYGIVLMMKLTRLPRNLLIRSGCFRSWRSNLPKLMEKPGNLPRLGYDGANESVHGNAKEQCESPISTKNILFIVGGAFDQLAEDVKKRLDLNRVGFGSPEGGKGI